MLNWCDWPAPWRRAVSALMQCHHVNAHCRLLREKGPNYDPIAQHLSKVIEHVVKAEVAEPEAPLPAQLGLCGHKRNVPKKRLVSVVHKFKLKILLYQAVFLSP